ncbi:TIR domain-containing protein [Terrabacter sp. C0L_2]|uniref:TIR domain-containing protein n=1 Tax=Terrabacter sp. C0L_2 TaxID=3108389 RepID=UPI002ED22C24|nr:TIR domain-containing protein [Terrabacter sp. C0L_2]
MSEVHVEQLRAAATRLDSIAAELTEEMEVHLDRMETLSDRAAKAWSGSNLGYHATVYYKDLESPPPGNHFSSEWGLRSTFAPGTTGDWREYNFEEVKAALLQESGAPDFEEWAPSVEAARSAFETEQSRFASLTSAAVSGVQDEYIADLQRQASSLRALSIGDAIQAQLQQGQMMTRDALAVSGGRKHAPHQEILAEVVAVRAPFRMSAELARLCRLAADHLEMSASEPVARIVMQGTKVFIGHGRSGEWRKLKDFLQDRLGLEWDEFNRVPVAGVTNIARLGEMLDNASIAFLVMTAEDEQVDGEMRARENVVHEAGLFQGRLGFERAIAMIEDTCGEFSNIAGLGQIRFPQGRIEAVFEDVRRVLEREGLLTDPESAD